MAAAVQLNHASKLSFISHARSEACVGSIYRSPMSTFATVGVIELGILIASVLYGVTTLQAWLYAEKYPTDKPYLRIMVSVLPIFF